MLPVLLYRTVNRNNDEMFGIKRHTLVNRDASVNVASLARAIVRFSFIFLRYTCRARFLPISLMELASFCWKKNGYHS